MTTTTTTSARRMSAPECLVAPDNGQGTADMPPQACAYMSQNDLHILNGLPQGSEINIAAVNSNFQCPVSSSVCSFPLPIPGVECTQPGGIMGGEQECPVSTLTLKCS